MGWRMWWRSPGVDPGIRWGLPEIPVRCLRPSFSPSLQAPFSGTTSPSAPKVAAQASLALFSVSGRRWWRLSCWGGQRLVIESGCLWLAQLVSSAFLNHNCIDGMGWTDHLGDSGDCWESGVSLQLLLGLPSSASCPSRAGRVLVTEEMTGGKILLDKLKNQSFCLSSIFAGFLQTFSYSLLW